MREKLSEPHRRLLCVCGYDEDRLARFGVAKANDSASGRCRQAGRLPLPGETKRHKSSGLSPVPAHCDRPAPGFALSCQAAASFMIYGFFG
jgi:hypothetical protein